MVREAPGIDLVRLVRHVGKAAASWDFHLNPAFAVAPSGCDLHLPRLLFEFNS